MPELTKQAVADLKQLYQSAQETPSMVSKQLLDALNQYHDLALQPRINNKELTKTAWDVCKAFSKAPFNHPFGNSKLILAYKLTVASLSKENVSTSIEQDEEVLQLSEALASIKIEQSVSEEHKGQIPFKHRRVHSAPVAPSMTPLVRNSSFSEKEKDALLKNIKLEQEVQPNSDFLLHKLFSLARVEAQIYLEKQGNPALSAQVHSEGINAIWAQIAPILVTRILKIKEYDSLFTTNAALHSFVNKAEHIKLTPSSPLKSPKSSSQESSFESSHFKM